MFRKNKPKLNTAFFSGIFRDFYDKFPKLLYVKRLTFSFVLVVGLVGLLFWQAFGRLKNYYMVDQPTYGGFYSEGLVGKVESLNPLFVSTNNLDADISSLIFSGLTKKDEARQTVPDLAYTWNVSENGLEYTFYLRRNAKWHGTNEVLKAGDVAFTVKAIQNPDTRSPLKESWRGVDVKVIDDWTVKFILPSPNESFLGMTTVGILPEFAFKSIPAKSMAVSKFSQDPIGTGPFEFESLVQRQYGQEITLIANNSYEVPHPAYLDKVIFKAYANREEVLKAYARKDINGIAGITSEERDFLKRFRSLNYVEMRLPRYVGIFFNTKEGIFSDKNLRLAVAKAIDKDRLIKDAGIAGVAVNYPVLPGYTGYSKDVPVIGRNLEEARKILDDNGWKLEKGVRTKDGKKLEFELVCNNSSQFGQVGHVVANQLAEAGIKVNVKTVDLSQLQNGYIKGRKYQALLIGESLGGDSDLYSYWHSTQAQDPGLNLSVYANDKLDKNLEAARQAKDEDARKDKVVAAQKIIQADVPAVFLYSPNYIYAIDKKFKGIKNVKMIDPASRFVGIYEWYVRTVKANKL